MPVTTIPCNAPPISFQQAESYAAQAGFTGSALSTILAIAQAESGLNPCALNCNNKGGSCDRGVLQINNFYHPEVSDACAFDPACAFQQGYRISNAGQSFTAWATFINGSYRKFLFGTNFPVTVGTHSTNAGTVATIFQQRGVYQWWLHPTQYFGQNGELGTDYGMAGFYVPVGAITSGTVVDVTSNNNSIGFIVQIKSSDGLYWYQHLASTNLHVGDVVNIADTVGLGGGCPPGCYGNNPRCTCYDQYSTGQHIEVRWSPNGVAGSWVDPQQHFLTLAGNSPSSGLPVSLSGNQSSFFSGSFFTNVPVNQVSLAPNADVIQVFVALDQMLSFSNPFNVVPVQDSINVPGGSISFADPVSYVGDVFNGFVNDFVSFVLRAALVIGGFFIIYKVSSAFIDYQAIGSNTRAIGTAALGLL